MWKFLLTKVTLIFVIASVVGQVPISSWPPGTYVPNVCICASQGQCSFAGGGAMTDGSGQIDPRILTIGGTAPSTPIPISMNVMPIHTGINIAAEHQELCPDSLERCCPPFGYTCGVRYPPPPNAPSTTSPGQAAYGSYPFQTAILDTSDNYLGSGVLVDQFNVLTAAHKVANITVPMKVRLGAHDISARFEILPRFETAVTVTIHPNYTVRNLKNNIAVLRLTNPVPLGRLPTLSNICIPNAPITSGRCMVSGWGRNDTNGVYQGLLREVDVPLVELTTCQRMLRATRLGQNFWLDGFSFVCAGGEAGKDACLGDGGAPLSCFIDGRFYLAGLVAWGINCGSANVPGVYVNVQSFIPWIQQVIRANGNVTAGQTTARVGAELPTSPAITDSGSDPGSSAGTTTRPSTTAQVTTTRQATSAPPTTAPLILSTTRATTRASNAPTLQATQGTTKNVAQRIGRPE